MNAFRIAVAATLLASGSVQAQLTDTASPRLDARPSARRGFRQEALAFRALYPQRRGPSVH